MTQLEWLTKISDPECRIEWVRRPFAFDTASGWWTGSTDGRIAVCVRGRFTDFEYDWLKRSEHFPGVGTKPVNLDALKAICGAPLWPKKCEKCDGEGVLRNGHMCKRCEGTGETDYYEIDQVQIGNQSFDKNKLAQALCGVGGKCVANVPDSHGSPVRFDGYGWYVLVMGLKEFVPDSAPHIDDKIFEGNT